MSGGKVTVSGTNYKIIGGKCTIGGTNYTIGRGKTTVSGTNYNIFLKKQTLTDLLKSAKKISRNGQNMSTAERTVYAQLSTAGTYYAFSFYIGYLTISKLVSTGSAITKTNLFKANSSYTDLFVSGNVVYLSKRGNTTSVSNVDYFRAGSLLVVQFPGYSVSQIDALLSAVTATNRGGFDNSSTSNLYSSTSYFTGKIALVAVGTNIAFVSIPSTSTKTVLFSETSLSNTSLLYMTTSQLGYSENGTSLTGVYGGSLIQLS